ncbi:MAG: hypothetical protein OGMRLDGQ_002197 [Candidatus Fervidibacter sp.]
MGAQKCGVLSAGCNLSRFFLPMPLALASEGQGTRDMGFDRFFLSAEFIQRKILDGASPDAPKKFSVMLEGTSPDVPKIFGSAGALPSRKTTRYSPLAIRCCFGSAGASPSHFIPSLVPRPTPLVPF